MTDNRTNEQIVAEELAYVPDECSCHRSTAMDLARDAVAVLREAGRLTVEQLSGIPGQFTEEQVEAAAKAIREVDRRSALIADVDLPEYRARAALRAADAVVTEEAHDEGMEAVDWDMVRDGVGDPQEAASIAVRAALVAAQGAAPQAEGECDNHRPVQHRDGKPPWCNACGLGRPVQPSSGVDEDALAEVIARASHRVVGTGTNPRIECADPADVARAVAAWLKDGAL